MSKYYSGLLPTSMIEENDQFQLEIKKNTDLIFLSSQFKTLALVPVWMY